MRASLLNGPLVLLAASALSVGCATGSSIAGGVGGAGGSSEEDATSTTGVTTSTTSTTSTSTTSTTSSSDTSTTTTTSSSVSTTSATTSTGGGACLPVDLVGVTENQGAYQGTIVPAFGGADLDVGAIYFSADEGTFDLSAEQQYATATHGFIAGQDIDAAGNVVSYFFQSQGQMTIDATTWSVTGVRLVEVTIDVTGESTPVPGGACLDFGDVAGEIVGGSVPATWTCLASYYNAADGCDCACGAYDPDCDLPGATIFGCSPDEVCVPPGVCAGGVEATCDDFVDNDSDGLYDCGDPDCMGNAVCTPGATPVGLPCAATTECAASNGAPACLAQPYFSFNVGACSMWCSVAAQDCDAGQVCVEAGLGDAGLCAPMCAFDQDCAHPDATCVSGYCLPNGGVPASWTCDVGYYGTSDGCDCGCGAADPDCVDATVSACGYCDDPGSCSAFACPGTINPVDNAVCN